MYKRNCIKVVLYVQRETLLNKINIGEQGIICECNLEEQLKNRGLDFGIIKGALIRCVGISSLGDPKAYSIAGTTFALRNVDANKITVRCIE